MSEAFIELRNIGKRFSGVHALDDVSLTINKGEIHCLAGENGSGKSTLIKVIAGVYQPDAGEILIDGKTVRHLTPIESVRHAIQVIYQDFSLFGNLTVAENLALNTALRAKRKTVNWRAVHALAREALDRLGVEIDLTAELETLPTSGKQLVAIARALMSDARLIIMDEPTTALTGKEVETLFRIVRDIQARGIAVLFVSHKMREMLDISERLTVIRNGRKVVEGPTSDFDEGAVIRHMTGQDIVAEPYRWSPPDGAAPAPRLEVRGLSRPGHYDDLSMTIGPGEIVGLSGLLGSGRTELALALFGMQPPAAGTILIDGRPVTLGSVRDAIDAGVAYVPEDRLSEGLFLTQSIKRNILVTSLDAMSRWTVLDLAQGDRMARETVAAMQIATPTPEKIAGELSGGNQQRVVLGRWLLTNAKVLILNGPTVGVDVGSKAEIHQKIRELALSRGLGVLMISDDVLELAQNCNRVVLMHRGRFVDEWDGDAASERVISETLKTLT
ncbi:sugar ABC transporter ATP-binding protein [Roseospira visakhapatnamensis]|uniref:Simple sugar transport system ATP-binding protein n=1 Tax=Roseospira visakhapatnamensis TaxID=390880 RepID=A0A7W6RDC0_9PROT|nr:sugar ABC transporter ATP-binding protein [Roseospira visakhapatnamensis]MBB4266484.1 simple sugar transport system ATP-binding protein [Roseospira visakhapatnamensis]